MEQLSKIIKKYHFPVEIEIQQYMRDHQFAGRVVLPAVESCQILSANLKKTAPEINDCHLYNASFSKFIDIGPEQNSISATNDIEVYEDGSIVSKLLTKTKAPKSGITRVKEHVTVRFKKEEKKYNQLPYDTASALYGICCRIPSQKIYNDLVLFGPAYHNIVDILYVSPDGCVAYVKAASFPALTEPLGSPFPFDAALQAACIWGQKFCGIVAFPVGFDSRRVFKPTIPGEIYFSRVIPVKTNTSTLIFDIWIYDNGGNLRELAEGVKIKDMNAGKIKPPDWILKENIISLENISRHCKAVSVVELDTIAEFATKALSDIELTRHKSMRKKRSKSFISARLACKYLSRKLCAENRAMPARKITTFINEVYPACPVQKGAASFNLSASHDNRFAIAVASEKRVGVDVEEISRKVIKSQRFYMSDDEKNLAHLSDFGLEKACLRVWSIKEAVTKAIDIKFAESLRLVQVNNIGENNSTLMLNGEQITAYHDTVDNHLFTLIEIEDEDLK